MDTIQKYNFNQKILFFYTFLKECLREEDSEELSKYFGFFKAHNFSPSPNRHIKVETNISPDDHVYIDTEAGKVTFSLHSLEYLASNAIKEHCKKERIDFEQGEERSLYYEINVNRCSLTLNIEIDNDPQDDEKFNKGVAAIYDIVTSEEFVKTMLDFIMKIPISCAINDIVYEKASIKDKLFINSLSRIVSSFRKAYEGMHDSYVTKAEEREAEYKQKIKEMELAGIKI